MAQKAIYYDGKSSKPYQVFVKDTIGGLYIKSIDDSGPISCSWDLDKVSKESFATGDKVLLSYGDFPYERLELNGDGSEALVAKVLSYSNSVKKYEHYITRADPIKLVLTSLAVLGVVLYSYVFHVSPYVGEQAVKLVPKNAEAKIGEVMYNNMSYVLDIDNDKSILLLDFYKACGFESVYDIRFDYASNDLVNAFAVPGGQIVVFEGLIRETECWDELAALMGHELAHVNERHSFKQLSRSMSSYLLLSVLTGDVAGASSVLLEQASQIQEMTNSRTHEKEADIVGMDYLKKNKIRPQAMMDLFSRLMSDGEEEASDKIGGGIEYLSTHPLTVNRIAYLEDLINEDSSFNYDHSTNPDAERIWSELKAGIGESNSLEILNKIKEKVGLSTSVDTTNTVQDSLK